MMLFQEETYCLINVHILERLSGIIHVIVVPKNIFNTRLTRERIPSYAFFPDIKDN